MPQRDHSAESEIILAVLDGDTDQFGVLAERYGPALFRFADGRLGNQSLAEEATQEALLSAFKSLHTYDSRYSFRTWLWTILLNQCKRQYRRQQVSDRTEADVLANQHVSAEPSPEQQAIQNEYRVQLNRLLDQLPPTQADALRLRFFGDLTFQEIADAMQCSLGTAKNRVKAGLQKISYELADFQPIVNQARSKS
ncbi:MAG: RNA polymerase sigma factor [Planctomycetales bacterium]|nr:RNA polymerase sigma factor [Planctomycetales bacterium]